MKIEPERLRKELITTLEKNEIPFKEVSVFRAEIADTVLIIEWTEEGEILLRYSSLLEEFTEREIRAVLKHEVCHYLSLPSAEITPSKDLDTFNVRYYLLFREYLAHKEFKERFGHDAAFESYQRKIFAQYYDYLLEGSKYILKNSKDEKLEIVMNSVLSMAYTATYYLTFEDNALKKWCDKNEISNLYVLFSWIYDDMVYFDRLPIGIKEKEQIIQSGAGVILSLDYRSLVINNELKLHRKILEKQQLPEGFSNRWEKRLKDYGVEII